MNLKNDLLLRAARGETIERTPVWLMRQAGRILPQYRALRKKVKDFKGLIANPELACEVTLQPVKELGVDAAIIFSDILVIPEEMGLPYNMIDSVGPRFQKTVKNVGDIKSLHVCDGDELDYVYEAISLVKEDLNNKIPLIGFSGAPWTLFAYMVEGGGSKTFSKAKKFLFTESESAHKLLDMISDSVIAYLQGQIDAGVDIVQIFDSWAGVLSPEAYNNYSLPYLQKICNAIDGVPIIVFAKDAHYVLEDMKEVKCDVVGLDWTMPISESRKRLGKKKTLQGNLDPCILYSDAADIKLATEAMLKEFGSQKHIANLGHGVYPDTPLDGVKCFIDTVKQYKFE